MIVVLLPEHSKSRTIRKLITPRLTTISYMLQNSIEYLSYKYKLPTNVHLSEKIPSDAFREITGLDNTAMNFSYRLMGKHGWVNHSTGEIQELEHFLHERKVIMAKIDAILSLPFIEYEEDELLDCLVTLRDSEFYNGVEAYQKIGLDVIVVNFNEKLREYYKCYQVLSRFIRPHSFEVI